MNNNNAQSGTMNPSFPLQVTDIETPESNDQTVPQTAAPPEKPQPTPQTQQTQPQGQTLQAQQQQQQGQKQPDLSKAPQQAPVGPIAPPKPPQVQRANILNEVAETLAGGPRFSYSVDEYGNMQRTRVPVSNAHLALAIAMEAIGGGITGAANGQGPNGVARGTAAAFNQQRQQTIQQNQQQQQLAKEDFTRRAQVTEMNMRLYNNARAIGKMDEEATDKYIAQYAPIAEKLQAELPGYVRGVAKYSDFAKYNITMDSAIPFKRVPRIGNDGKQITDSKGIPQWDIDYLIIDPSFKTSGLLSDDDRKSLTEMGENWANNEMLGSVPLTGMMALNQKSRAAQWEVAKTQFNQYADTINEAKGNAANVTATTAPTLEKNINDLAEKAAEQNGVDSKYIKALIKQESDGNIKAVSPTGAKGLMQLTSGTAKEMGVTDPFNAEQNVSGGTKYFKQLMDKYKDPRLAFAAYYSGPGAIQNGKIVATDAHSAADTQKYVDSVSKNLGLQVSEAKEQEFKTPSMADYTKNHPTFPADVEKFNGALHGTDGNYGKALEHMRSSGQADAANNISAFLGGDDNIKLHDDYVTAQAQQRHQDILTKAAEEKVEFKQKQDEAVQQKKEDMINSLLQAKIPDNLLKMNDRDAVTTLQNAGVTLPPDALIDAKAIANYKSPLNIASNKRWFKDAKMDQGELLSIVHMFNPSYDTKNFDSIRAENMPNSPQRKTVESAAQLANHLDTMLQVVNSQAPDKSTIPMMNRLIQGLGYETGGTQLTDVQTMANIVTSELGKTLAGGFAPDKAQIDNIISTMNPANATRQMKSIIGLYIAAMHGKVAPLDDDYNQLSGASDQHLIVPKTLSRLLQSYGYDTPWDPTYKPPVPGAKAGRDAQGNIVAWKLPNGQIQKVQPQQPQPQQ